MSAGDVAVIVVPGSTPPLCVLHGAEQTALFHLRMQRCVQSEEHERREKAFHGRRCKPFPRASQGHLR
jgi:hypothetical protein